MRIRHVEVCFLWVVLFSVFSGDLSAQSEWQAVSSLESGTRVRITPQGVQGTIRGVDDTRIVVVVHRHLVELSRPDIRRIEVGHNLAKRKSTIGFIVGWALGTLQWREAKGLAPLLGLGLGGFGALIGVSDGAFDYRYTIIYESPVP
jgi:hypothetical protein